MKKHALEKKLSLYFLVGIVGSIIFISLYIYFWVAPNILQKESEVNIQTFNSLTSKIQAGLNDKIKLIDDLSISDSELKSEEVSKAISQKAKGLDKTEKIYAYTDSGYFYGNVDKSVIDFNVLNKYRNPLKTNIGIQKEDIFIIKPYKINKENGYVVYSFRNQYIKDIVKNSAVGNIVVLDKFNENFAIKDISLSQQDIAQIFSNHTISNLQLAEFNKNISIFKELPNTYLNIMCIAPKDLFYSNSYYVLENFIKTMAIYILLLVVIFGFLIYAFVNSSEKIIGWIKAIQKNEFDFKIKFGRFNLFSEIGLNFIEMIEKLKANHNELEKQTEQLYERTWQVEEANKELEDSYLKLQETINQLNEAEEKYYSLVKNLPEIVCVIDMDGIIIFANDVIIDILGYSKEELIGENIDILLAYAKDRNLISLMNKRLKKQPKFSIEIPLKKKDGLTIVAEVKVTQHYTKGVPDGVQAIVRDVTKNKKLQKEIIHKNEELLTIYNISKSLSSTIELDSVFNLIVDEVCKILNADMCLLRSLDFTGKNLVLRAYSGNYFDDITENEIKDFMVVNANKVPEAIFKKEMVEVNNFDANWSIVSLNSKKLEENKIKQVIFMPISAKDKISGLIVVGSKNKVNDKHLNILNSIANNAAVAIENATLYENSKKYFIKTIDALIAAVEAKDKYTEGHSKRVSRYVEIIGKALGLSKEKIEDLKIAGILHDIGKIGISDNILLKPGRLTDEEYEEIKQHPIISNRILYSVGLSETTMKAIACHHERYDGKGYPFGLKEEELSIECQTIAVADALDAMTSNRAYRGALTLDEAIKEIIRNKGSQFGPDVVEVIIQLYEGERDKLLSVPKELDLIS